MDEQQSDMLEIVLRGGPLDGQVQHARCEYPEHGDGYPTDLHAEISQQRGGGTAHYRAVPGKPGEMAFVGMVDGA